MNFIKEVFQLYITKWDWFLGLLGEHLLIVLISATLAGILGIILGILVSNRPKLASVIISVCNILYTIPSIALFGLLIPLTGIGNKTAITALVIYGMMPMVRGTYTGLTGVDPHVIEAAVGMGSTQTQLLLRIRLPLAAKVILSGLRSMVVMTISVGGIASFIGAGGLGVAIYRGITIYDPAMTFCGGLLIAVVAFVADLLLGSLEKRITAKT